MTLISTWLAYFSYLKIYGKKNQELSIQNLSSIKYSLPESLNLSTSIRMSPTKSTLFDLQNTNLLTDKNNDKANTTYSTSLSSLEQKK